MIILEKFTQEDFDQLINWIHNEELLTNWAGSLFNFPLTHQSLEWYIKETNDLAGSDAFVYKAVDAETSQVVGHISLGGISRKNRSGRISRVYIDDQLRGKGYCKQMITAILRFGFNELQLHRISLGVYDFNTSAIKCYKASGFALEGVTRDALWMNETFWSLMEMSILEDEWRAMNA